MFKKMKIRGSEMKKALSLLTAVLLAITIITPITVSDVSAADTFAVRTSMPAYDSAVGKKYYYTNGNIFYQIGLAPTRNKLSSNSKYYCRGNCTWYAYARASEILGHNLNTNFRWAAGKWWSTNKSKKIYPYGSKPKAGAIACFSNHVAIVEKVEGGKIYYSESGWRTTTKKPTSASDIEFQYGTKAWGKTFQGYIYFTEKTNNNSEADIPSTTVNYQVKVSVKSLNRRIGPGTGYEKDGYVTPGTYTVDREYNGWGRINTGHWIYLTYTEKINSGTSASTAPAQTTSKPSTASASKGIYTVIVSVSQLNMRKGPGTNYGKVGYAKKGTYTVVEEKNGWCKLSDGYWVSKKYVTVKSNSATSNTQQAKKVKITVTKLNMRSGPGTKYSKKGYAKPGTYEVSQTSGAWIKLKSNGYWVYSDYVTYVK